MLEAFGRGSHPGFLKNQHSHHSDVIAMARFIQHIINNVKPIELIKFNSDPLEFGIISAEGA